MYNFVSIILSRVLGTTLSLVINKSLMESCFLFIFRLKQWQNNLLPSLTRDSTTSLKKMRINLKKSKLKHSESMRRSWRLMIFLNKPGGGLLPRSFMFYICAVHLFLHRKPDNQIHSSICWNEGSKSFSNFCSIMHKNMMPYRRNSQGLLLKKDTCLLEMKSK